MLRRLSLIALLVGPAFGDARLDELATGYTKEAASCKIHAAGVAKVLDGAKLLPADDAIAADVDALAKAHVVVQAYCDEVDGALALLHADPAATYKTLERQLDEKDNKIRKLRQSSKKTLDALQPVIQRMIPKVNAARVGTPEPADKKLPAKFPSGRAIELPKLAGTWALSGTATTDVAEYTEKAATTTITVRAFTGATCDQHRKALADKPALVETPDPRAAWKLSYSHDKRAATAMCVASKDGGWLATIDAPARDDRMTSVAWQMLAAQAPAKP